MGCKTETCDGFQCNNGNCISNLMTCDNEDDCGDASDESFDTCGALNRYYWSLKLERSLNFLRTCGENEFQCKNNKYCLPNRKLCNAYEEGDYYTDCLDASDEDPDFCASDDFKCPSDLRPVKCSGAQKPPFCISQKWVNDGMKDCSNGVDEEVRNI